MTLVRGVVFLLMLAFVQPGIAAPNILLIISDDQGIDASAQYTISDDPPVTPVLNGLAESGIVFENAWATPTCATTRAAILTGKYGVNTGFNRTPGVLDPKHQTLQEYLSTHASEYASGVFGKWHVGAHDANHPAIVGVEHFAGSIGNPGDYFDWELTINGVSAPVYSYHTTVVTDLAIDWVSRQNGPWFAWVAYAAPHPPFHTPPKTLHDRVLSGSDADIRRNPRNYYLAAIEAMDSEIGRLLNSLPEIERANTVVIYVGDNGSPRRVVDSNVYGSGHVKGTLNEGGIRVPLFVSGARITRPGERESALVSVVDLFATIADIAGSATTVNNDSVSFSGSFSDDQFAARSTVYSAYDGRDVKGWTIRDARYKLLVTEEGGEQLFDLSTDLKESHNLLPGGERVSAIKMRLEKEAQNIQTNTGVQSGGAQPSLDITDTIFTSRSASCADYVDEYFSMAWDVNNASPFFGALVIEVDNSKCTFSSNAIPNHDFNDRRGFPNNVQEQDDVYEIASSPSFADSITPLSLVFDNAIMLNGVKVDLLAAACHGVADERIGCNDPEQPWRFDPMFSNNGFRMDSHNAHTQPDGTYHYHGSPNAMFDASGGTESPVVGFAADGFPIFGTWIRDNDTLRQMTSSYRLKSGSRPATRDDPGGDYDGSFRDDFEYVEGSGDLDECNGATIDGVYAYYITESYPYMMACFRGTPDPSFRKGRLRR
jgi:arylsulfatase A-like enzyme